MKLRKIFFWLHLTAGVVAGTVILVMSFTGAVLAFEKDIIAWAERDVRLITPPATTAPRLSLDDLLARVREKQPGARPSGVTVDADPKTAVMVSFGRTNSFFANPYSGEIRQQGANGVRGLMQVMIDWHRWLGGSGDNRAMGKAITGACNAAFLVLAVTGLYLWLPRIWSWDALRGIALFNFKLRGKPRDWNWHNVIGLWCAPVLIVLTATALPISYRWAGDLIYKLSGSEPPPAGAGPGGSGASAVEMPKPVPGAKPLGLEALFVVAKEQGMEWDQITLRIGGSSTRTGSSGGGPGARTRSAAAESGPRPKRRREGVAEGRAGASPVTVSIKERGARPRFASTQITLDPYSGAVLRRETFGDYNLGRKVRSWTRFLHTGEALGPVGQAVAGTASLGGVVLVWTGLALACRRFFAWRRRSFSPVGDSNRDRSNVANDLSVPMYSLPPNDERNR
jgi:uncharacterized iron-regulated membrane protein